MGLAIGLLLFWNCLPNELFDTSKSLMVLDQSGKLVGARIASDEQWRFVLLNDLPDKFQQALVCYEDKRFWKHPGIDLLAIGRAIKSNVQAGEIISGGSTLTMQLMRMSRGQKRRTVLQKAIEAIMALRAEMKYSKSELLQMYASHAPFGGNIVGLEAATWRYFGKSPELLTWSEAATLAVLPNSPGLIHPGRNRARLLEKRDLLLDLMVGQGIIDQQEAQFSKLERIPPKPFPLPQFAPHFTDFISKTNSGIVKTTLNLNLQKQVNEIMKGHHFVLEQNEIHNLAGIVMDTKTGAVLAYIGNHIDASNSHENAIDLIQAERSSGSILKPFLYAAAIEDGLILPTTLLPDVPTIMSGYRPENFSRTYEGKVPADQALARSLNVPAVHLLKQYGVERFRKKLIDLGFSTIHFSAEHYGLPLILGGAEVTLWDLAGVYGSMGRTLNHAFPLNHQYRKQDLHSPVYLLDAIEKEEDFELQSYPGSWHYGALWSVMNAMQEVSRPLEDGSWELFQSAQHIHWKTGTSYGFRDAWSVGVTPDYTVAIWVGNADGEGRPGLVGVRTAAPIMFDIFRLFPENQVFEPPYDALQESVICRLSGHPAGTSCEMIDALLVPDVASTVEVCPYHTSIWVTENRKWQVHQDCANVGSAMEVNHFVLDPLSANYYRQYHPQYHDLPPLHPDCGLSNRRHTAVALEVAYPAEGADIYLPVDLDKEVNGMICQATPTRPSEVLYWYLDASFLGTTKDFHTMKIEPEFGSHRLTVVDHVGNRVERNFEILSK